MHNKVISLWNNSVFKEFVIEALIGSHLANSWIGDSLWKKKVKMTYYTPNIWGVFFDLTNKFHKKPPFAYEKVEKWNKIGTILIGSRLKDGDLIGFNYKRFEKIKSNNYKWTSTISIR